MGRLRDEEPEEHQGDTHFNAPTLIQSRDDAIAAMHLIAERRGAIEQQKLAKKQPPIDVTATEVGSA